MDLGKVKLQRTGLNTLHQAIHPLHGIAWTDGKQVCLTSVYFVEGEPKFGDTNVIGQFEHVFGLYWGPLCCSGSPALLAVQHKKHVTVWQLQLSSLEQNKLLCTQTCEMSEPFPLLSQGCVWHPKTDILAILTKRDASVLFSVRVDNRRVRADIKGSGLIHCACWTRDGKRLVVAIGSSLHAYIWNDIQRSLTACSFCPIFDIGGYICAIDSTEDAQVAVATELPVDNISGLSAGMAFDFSSEGGSPHRQPSVSMLEDDWCSDARRRSIDSERSLALSSSPSPYGPGDMSHVLARHRKSDPNPLIHMRRKDPLTGSGQGSSYLILVTYERKVTTVRKVSIPGILVPDVMAFDASGRTVAVASNTCNMVLVYAVTPMAMPNMQQIQLQRNERPKGVCFLNDRLLLLMVGRQKSNDPTFLPSSNTEKYTIRLMTKELIYNEEMSPPAKNMELGVHYAGIRRHSDEPLGMREHLAPTRPASQSPSNRRRQTEEGKSGDPSPVTSLADFSDRPTSSASSIAVEHFDMDHVKRIANLAAAGQNSKESRRASSPRLEARDKLHSDPAPLKDSCPLKDSPLDQLSQNMERLFARFAEKQLSENVFIDERRPVLLCENRLRLGVVRDLFNLSVVEMMHGPLWVVLVEDADGFVPLTFKHDSELTIRNGRRKTAESLPREPEESEPQQPDTPGSET
ncbi:hypothetical protein MATL_G00158200 [Megalops atlanticus]|uniref:WD repeat and coiled-coil-containing protein n=1 Tax=Megalops atlanticus TaxID=7932 RepID=A0A9D3T1B3_MEGAT|nr:hypothetical protein MATL_G00158200 [Megalops atlanticus]